MKELVEIMRSDGSHWVGDGFPVHSLFSYHGDTAAISPFLLFDYVAPHSFTPNMGPPRGVGQHPHRGFETVTIVYEGEVSHRDSSGGGGTIGAGDVQWMTAAGGIIHEEYHSDAFSRAGGVFHVVQLWVNLPAKNKMRTASYQGIKAEHIPNVALDGGTARIIAGELDGTSGPAHTFSPINLWDIQLAAGKDVDLALPDQHNAMIAVLSGSITIAGETVGPAEIARLSRNNEGVKLHTNEAAMLLVMTGEPIDEPVFGYGPFVMNSEAEIRTAIQEFNSGNFLQPANN